MDSGFGATSSVLKFDGNDIYNPPIEVESLIHDRRQHACTIFYSPVHDGRPVVIVAGGLGLTNQPEFVSDKAEIWDYTIDGSKWEKSKIFSTKFLGDFTIHRFLGYCTN